MVPVSRIWIPLYVTAHVHILATRVKQVSSFRLSDEQNKTTTLKSSTNIYIDILRM